jgi:hypothetical protein
MGEDRSWIESKAFNAPFVRVRGRVSRRGEVSWSPCLRTFKGPDGLQHARPPAKKRPGDERKRTAPAVDAIVVVPTASDYWVACETEAGHELVRTLAAPRWFYEDQEFATFTVRVPYHRTTRRVVLGRGRQRLGELDVPAAIPNFDLSRPVRVEDIDTEGVLHLRWVPGQTAKRHPQTYFVRFTSDGRRFYRVGFSLTDESFDLDLRTMPGGEQCHAEVLATNGYQTAVAATPVFALPRQPPQIMVGPLDGPELFAQGYSLEDGPLTGRSIQWSSSGRALASGGSYDARGLGEGTHVVTVSVTAPDGQRVQQDLGFYDGTTGLQTPNPRRM